MKKHKTKIKIIIIFAVVFLMYRTHLNVQAQFPIPALSKTSTVTIEGNQIWKTTVIQEYEGKFSDTLNFPIPYILFDNYRKSSAIQFKNLKILNDGIELNPDESMFLNYVWIVKFSEPVKWGNVRIEYEVYPEAFHEYLNSGIYFEFAKTEFAKFQWIQGEDGVALVNNDCSIIDETSLVNASCNQLWNSSVNFTASTSRGLKPAESFGTALWFESDAGQANLIEGRSTSANVHDTLLVEDRRNGVLGWIWYIPISLLLAYIILAILYVRNKVIPLPIIAQYEPPEDLPISLAGMLLDGKVKANHLRAALIQSIIEERVVYKPEASGDPKELHIVGSLNSVDGEYSDEDYALDTLFRGKDFLKMNTIFDTNNNSATISYYKDTIRKKLENFGLIYPRYHKFVAIIAALSFIFLTFSDALIEIKQTNYILVILVSAVLLVLCVYKFPLFTPKGRKLRNYLYGYKLYIDTVEAGRLNKNDLRKTKLKDDKNLIPYAVLFGHKLKRYEHLNKYLPNDFWVNYSNLEDQY